MLWIHRLYVIKDVLDSVDSFNSMLWILKDFDDVLNIPMYVLNFQLHVMDSCYRGDRSWSRCSWHLSTPCYGFTKTVNMPGFFPKLAPLSTPCYGFAHRKSNRIYWWNPILWTFNSMLWIQFFKSAGGWCCWGSFQLHVMDSRGYNKCPDPKQFFYLSLSTPCYGFKEEDAGLLEILEDVGHLSTPCYGFPCGICLEPSPPPSALSTPCYGFPLIAWAYGWSPETSFNSMLWILHYGGCCSGLSYCNHLFLLSFPLP